MTIPQPSTTRLPHPLFALLHPRPLSTLLATAFFALFFIAADPSTADELYLTDGSKIVCQIQRLSAGKLTIKTDFADELAIDASKIQGFSTSSPVYLQLHSGNRVLSQANYQPGAGLELHSALGSPQIISPTTIKALWLPDQDSPDVAAAKDQYEAARSKWALRLELGLDGATGNTERVALNSQIQAKLSADQNRLALYATGRFASENGNETVREFIGGANLESDLTDRLFLFAKTEFENDKFENLDLRATLSAGLGYFLIKHPDTELKIRGGPGFQHETFTTGDSQDSTLAETGWDLTHKLAPWVSLTHNATLTVPFENPQHWRAVVENAAEIPLNPKQDWKIRIGVKNQFDALPQPDVQRLDTNYFLNLVWDFL